MELDYQLMFDASTTLPLTGVTVAVTAGSTQNSTNVLDWGTYRDVGLGGAFNGTPKIMCLVTTTFTSTGAGTLTVQVAGSTDGTTYNVMAASGAIQKSQLIAGTKILNIDVPSLQADPSVGQGTASTAYGIPRFMRLQYVGGTSSFSAGAVIAGITLGHDQYRTYPIGTTVVN